MDIFNYLNNKIIVTADEYKSVFIELKKNNPLLNFKIMSEKEVIERLSFDYDINAVVEIIHRKHVSFKSATEIIKILRIIDEKTDFDDLLNLKKDLIELGYIKPTDYEKIMLKRNTLFLFNEKNNKELQSFLKNNDINYEFFGFENLGIKLDKELTYKKYENRFQQFEDICNKICELLSSGVDENEIAIRANYSDLRYYFDIFSNLYGLKFYYKDKRNITTFTSIQNLVKKIYNERSFEIEINATNEYLAVAKDLISKYRLKDLDFEFAYTLFGELLSKVNEKTESDSGILITPDFNLSKRLYTFELDFNFDNYPRVYGDTSYYNDETLNNVGLNPSYIKTKIDDEKKKAFLLYSNVILSTPITTSSGDVYLSGYINELNIKDESNKICNIRKYSGSATKIDYKLYKQYFEKSKYWNNIETIFSKYINFDDKYDYRFKNFDIKDYKLTKSSYTKMTAYFQCPFQYYCKNVLKLNSFKETNQIHIGLFTHSLLEKVYDDDFDFEREFNKKVEEFKDKISLGQMTIIKNNLKDKIEDICNWLITKRNEGNIVKTLSETNAKFTIDNVEFDAKIDSILISEHKGKKFATIIDYKTGKFVFDEDQLIYGLCLQLPTYGLAMKSTDLEILKGIEPNGLFIQNIFAKPASNKNNMSLEALRDTYRYQGVWYDDDTTYDNFYIRSLLNLSDDESTPEKPYFIKSRRKEKYSFDNVIDIGEAKIHEYIRKENNHEFEIHPYKLKDVTACKYCEYRNICYRSNNCFNVIKEENEEDTENGY